MNVSIFFKSTCKYILLACLLSSVCWSMSSCDDNYLSNDYQTERRKSIQNVNVTKDHFKAKFGYALAKVLVEDQGIRQIIKEEALKKIDYDYDVLYSMIKNSKSKTGRTLEELLLKYIPSDSLSMITELLPTLTIFVPQLPENIFSAETWDSSNTIPKVGIRLSSSVPIVDEFGNERILHSDEIPAFPVIVVKENERVIVNNSPNSRSISNNELNNIGLTFIDPTFDNSVCQTRRKGDRNKNRGNNGGISKRDSLMDPRFQTLKEAYKEFPTGTGGWQRDYIYYNITSANPNGPFNNQYREYIWGFQMEGDVLGVVNKICDQQDPYFKGNIKAWVPNYRTGGLMPRIEAGVTGWTDGEFEFQVKTYVASTTAVGNEIISYFRVKASDLFSIVGERKGDVIKIYTATNKLVLFNNPIPLFSWNLEEYSSTIKMEIEEVDLPQVTKTSVTGSSEFATNFKFEPKWNKVVKTGIGFGGSAKTSKSVTYEITTTLGNDALGEVIISFGDPVLKDTTFLGANSHYTSTTNPYYYLNLSPQYYTGWYRVYVGPGPTTLQNHE